MSRTRIDSRLLSAVAGGVVMVVLYLFIGYLAFLNHRLSTELLGFQWRVPTEIYSARGALVARVYGGEWRATTPVLLRDLPRHVPDAFVAAEDVRFRHHLGFDPIGIGRALFTNVRAGGIAQGGSTIDQQLIKSKFLTSERTWRRKIMEILLAVILDARMSKDDILEAYLNDVYLGHVAGHPVLGIDEAARLYFDKRPSRLTVGESALLAGIVRAPNRDTPDKRPDLARARRDAILAVMRKHGWITDAQYSRAVAEEVEFTPGLLPPQPFPFYLAALRGEVTQEVGDGALREGRLRVVSEIDPVMQRAAERAVRAGVASLNRRYSWLGEQSDVEPLQAAIVAADPQTGGIRALVGGSDFNRSPFDRTLRMKRQPGSAFKPFAYLAAIASKKYTASSFLLDEPLKIAMEGGDDWEPHNYDERYRGRVTVRESLEGSLNVPTVRLTRDIGTARVSKLARAAGFGEDFRDIPALPLGVTEVTMRELTRAYSIFPNLGQLSPELHLLAEVRGPNGKVLYRRDPEKLATVVGAAPAFVVHTLLRGVVQRGTASRLRRYDLSFVAGKTGTTNDYRDAWFVGYAPGLVATAWVGYDHGAPLRLSSAEAAIPVWGAFARDIPLTRDPIDKPEGVVAREIDPESGFLWAEGCPGPTLEYYLSGTAPTRHCPRGVLGEIFRQIFFGKENFDEPPAITFEQFRRWSGEVDRQRQDVEGRMGRIRRWLFGK